MSLIDTTYFKGLLSIANLSRPEIAEAVTNTITAREDEFMIKVLGYGFYSSFKAGLAVLPTPAQIWLDLKNGKEYTNGNGFTRKWNGFAPTTKISPIANYVWFYYMRDINTQITGVGSTKAQAENAQAANPAYKQAEVFNQISEMLNNLWDFLYLNATSYPTYESAEINKTDFRHINPFNI